MDFPDAPAGPPLGLGSGPFATAEWEVAEDSQLVLYGHGLMERRVTGADAGFALPRGALSRAAARTDAVGPEETCAAVLDALPPVRPRGAVALLVARTRGMSPDQVADWDVPAGPAAVADLRTAVTHRLAHSGLDDLALTTEFILSELVNNAIRCTTDPIHLRLLCDHTLTCEAFDSSSASRPSASSVHHGRGRTRPPACRPARRAFTRQPDRPSRPLPGLTRDQSPRVDLGADTPLQTPAYPPRAVVLTRAARRRRGPHRAVLRG
ncbi:SpoIIE family protein phosphatase [Streptomyces sp. NPDC007896]|uniref:SpoIIE family protein phosphatase n=1 Tax=Streptomyces sp. NPDC007896 TaxID=3364784 RepID=UPI0036EFEAF8